MPVLSVIRAMHLPTLALMACLGLLLVPDAAQSQSRPLNARCTLQIDGTVHLDDRCHFRSHRDHDEFDDLRIQITCPDGRSAENSDCIGAEQRVVRRGVFGSLFREGGAARLCWNTATARKAHECFEGLRRTGACWENPRASSGSAGVGASSVRFCAWRL